MDRIEREHARLCSLMERTGPGPIYGQLYAAQHALNWVRNPKRFGAPFDFIKDIPATQPDCSERSRQAPSPESIAPIADAA